MLFRSVAALFTGVLFAQGAFAALTPAQVVTNIGVVTTLSGSINDALGKLTTSSSPGVFQTTFQTTSQGFQTIISDLSGDITAMQQTPPFGDADATVVASALREFVRIHQLLLSTVIGKHGIFAQFGATAPIAALLRNLEGTIDSFAFAMIDLIPTKAPEVTGEKDGLDNSIGNAITLYEQICIPSPLYPTVMPVCVGL